MGMKCTARPAGSLPLGTIHIVRTLNEQGNLWFSSFKCLQTLLLFTAPNEAAFFLLTSEASRARPRQNWSAEALCSLEAIANTVQCLDHVELAVASQQLLS
jgi:hypothetical protein